MTKVTQKADKVTRSNRQWVRAMFLADQPALSSQEVAELAELAKGLGLRIEIERFDLNENKFSSFVLG